MAYERDLLDALEERPQGHWEGTLFRFVFGSLPPENENRTGARWNPPDVRAIYAALDREAIEGEFEHRLSVQPVRPSRGTYRLFTLACSLSRVVDLSEEGLLPGLGVGAGELSGDDQEPCQVVGGAAEWLGIGAIIVPSARASGLNMVIFPRNQPDFEFEVIGSEPRPV